MKLLIIDDEKLTREGIIATIDWTKLGIEKIYEADDGINGIKQARLHSPDIILSDIRMPRMNGIDMSNEVLKILPNTSIIFMSGYSDKEYLKAAISLKVISYVEKPINTLEIESALLSALDLQLKYAQNQITINNHIKYAQSKLALEIIYPPSKKGNVDYIKRFQDLDFSIKPSTQFTTLIITIKTSLSSLLEERLNKLYFFIEQIAKKHGMYHILSIKNDTYIILHLFTNNKTIEYNIQNICSSLSTYLSETYQNFIAVGQTVQGIENVYKSYNLAVLLLQSSFFYAYNSVIVSEVSPQVPIAFNQNFINRYRQDLKQHNKDAILEMISNLFLSFKNKQHILPNYAKDIYYKLFSILYETASSSHIIHFNDDYSSLILDDISLNNLIDLNGLLLNRINQFFSSLQEQNKDTATVFAIKEFIRKNYHNDNLSVKDISENVFLSSSYVCTLFKNETGKTLNQYLTKYRIEKAKIMLNDSKYKITEISSKVGYSDGNYFGKTFKKLIGSSPSEYRERFGK